jgi:hypothetical protein
MAEWTGQKRTLNSIGPAHVPPIGAASDHLAPPPDAPGATSSPQLPGMTPDQPDLPGHARGTLPPLASNRRPLSEYGSAQRLLRMFTPAPGTELTAADWEQGPSANEELRKVDPALGTPFRPLSGYGLGIGRVAAALPAAEVAAIAETTEVPPDVAEPGTGVPVDAAGIVAAASELPADAVSGNGTADCPDGFPIKGNAQSKIYHTVESRVYAQTIAEICFATPAAAEAAGYRPPKNL